MYGLFKDNHGLGSHCNKFWLCCQGKWHLEEEWRLPNCSIHCFNSCWAKYKTWQQKQSHTRQTNYDLLMSHLFSLPKATYSKILSLTSGLKWTNYTTRYCLTLSYGNSNWNIKTFLNQFKTDSSCKRCV